MLYTTVMIITLIIQLKPVKPSIFELRMQNCFKYYAHLSHSMYCMWAMKIYLEPEEASLQAL